MRGARSRGGSHERQRAVSPGLPLAHPQGWCRRAVETTEGLATGWLNWGFYDTPDARDVSQLTGLLTVDGKPKAWAREFQALAQRFAGTSVAPARLGPRPPLDWDRSITSPTAGRQFLEEYGEAFRGQRRPQ